MTARTIDNVAKQAIDSVNTLMNEICAKPTMKNYYSNKTDVNQIDVFWGLDLIDLNHFEPEIKRDFSHFLVVRENYSKFG